MAAAFLGLAATAPARLPHPRNVGSHPLSLNALDVRRTFHESQTPQAANPQALPLRPGESIQREIRGGETQELTIALLREQYALVTFTWEGMDLEVQVLKPNGTELTGSSVQVRGSGSMPVSLLADTDGDYKLIVRLTEKARVKGTYTALLEGVRPPGPADQKRISAGKLLAEAHNDKSREVAAQKLLQALGLWSDLGDAREVSRTLQLLGGLALTQAQKETTDSTKAAALRDAKDSYQKAIDFAAKGDLREVAYTLLEIGSDWQKFTSPDAALTYYQRALETFREIPNRHGEALALYSIGFAVATADHVPDAVKFYEPALVINRSEGDRLSEGKTLNALGGVYNVLGDQERALSYYQQAEPIWQELDDRYREAITTQNIGLIYDDLGDFQTAKNKYFAALAVYQSLVTRGDFNSCRAGMVSEDVRFCNSIANTLDNIGELYNSLGDPQSALETFRDGLIIRKTVNQAKGLGATLSRIGYAYLLENNPNEALSYCQQALPFSQEAGDKRKVGSILTFAGMAYTALNEPEKALAYFNQAKSLQEETGERRGLGITLDQMGRAYASKKDVVGAVENYNRALTIWHEVKDEEWETRTLYNLANIGRDQGDLLRAYEQIEKGVRIAETRRALLSSQKLRTSYFANKEEMYELDIDLRMQLSKAQGSKNDVTSALETTEKARARVFIDLLNESGVVHNLEVGFNRDSDPRLANLDARMQTVRNNLNFKGNYQTALLGKKHTEQESTAIAREIGELTNEYDELETQIRVLSPHYANLVKPEPLSAKEIQQQLDYNTLLLEYSLGDKRSYVWVVAPDSIQGFELKGRKEIEATAERMNKALIDRNRNGVNDRPQQIELHRDQADAEYSKAAAELSKLVIQPVAPLLGNKRLVIVADGALQLVSFGALPDPKGTTSGERTATTRTQTRKGATNDPTLLEDHEIVYEASASVLALQRKEFGSRQPARHALAVLADPVFDQEGLKLELEKRRTAKAREGQPQPGADSSRSSGDASARTRSDLMRAIDDMGIDAISPLPESREEAEAIMKVVPKGEGMEALGFDASRATVMSPGLSQYRIIHFATHGFADLDHPELSGIVLSLIDAKGQPQDGFLRLHDIYNLNLPADLVVLSACQTGVGKQIKGEGLIALTRGFTYAGAARVVASLWKVDDEATKILMEEFYKQMFTNGLKPAAALQKAQLKLSHQSEWRSPFYWAGFVIQGEWK